MKKLLSLLMTVCLVFALTISLAESNPVQSLATINQQDVVLRVGRTRTLTIKYDRSVKSKNATVIWASADPSIVTVNSKGTVTAISSGSAEVSCEINLRSGDVLHASTMVNVVEPVTQVAIIPDHLLSLGVGKTAKLETSVLPEDASSNRMLWYSADESIATVDSDGTVHGIAIGKTKITASAADGFGATASIEVEVSEFYADQTEITLETAKEIRMPVHYEGGNFEEDYEVSLDSEAVSYTVTPLAGIANFWIRPEAVTEGTHLTIQDRNNPQRQVNILIHVSETAISNAQKLPIVSAEIIPASILAYRFELKNNSDAEIGEIGFLVDYRDQFGDTHYLFSNTDGTIQNSSYTTMFNIQPGETLPLIGSNESFRGNDIITEVRLAIYYYRYVESGKKVYIPDSQLYWYSTKTGEMERPEITENYIQPDEETTDKADRITYNLQATTCDLYTFVVKPFCRSYRPGKYIAAVGNNGFASVWGLRAQDVIYGADDMLWAEDPFFLNRAFARVYDGKEVTLKVVRNGEEIEIPISKEINR